MVTPDEFVPLFEDNGFTIGLDDFGTGYSSLTILNEMPLDTLKLDKGMFTRSNSSKEKFLIDTCVKIGKNYDLNIEAEGIETREQLEMLKEMGCDSVQGFFFTRPLSVEMFEMRLKNND